MVNATEPKFTTPLNQRTIDPNTENIKLFGIVWLAHAYRVAGYIATWGQLTWFNHIAAFLMLVAFLLVVLGMVTPNHMAVGGEKLLMADEAARGIHRVTRHPFLWGVAVWAFGHLIVNGDIASLVLFGSLLCLVFIGMISIDAKRKKLVASIGTVMPPQLRSYPSRPLRKAGICGNS